LPPLEQIRVTAVRDHHETKKVRQTRDLSYGLGGRLLRQVEFEETDRLSALGHRGQYLPAAGRRAGMRLDGLQHLHRL
jgi:hypothetical protein